MNSNKNAALPKKKIIILSICALCVIVAVIFTAPYLFTGAPKTAEICLPRGCTPEQLTDSLKKHLGDGYTSRVMKVVSLLGSKVADRHGRYTIEEGMSPLTAGRILARGEQTPVKLTVNGFRSVQLLAERISRKMAFSPQDFMCALTDPKTLDKYGLKPGQEMALFLDDTYLVYYYATPQEVIEKIGDNYKKVWKGSRTEKAKKLGLTPADAIIICSIADEETAKSDEKGRITRLYLNRLQKGMKLQADPTVRFAIGDFTIKRVTRPMLSTDSPYNTYRHEGLPPGPIRTTSVATIDALLDSKPSDDLYMCAKEDFSGYHNFSSSYAEHKDNAKRYQKKLNELNIK